MLRPDFHSSSALGVVFVLMFVCWLCNVCAVVEYRAHRSIICIHIEINMGGKSLYSFRTAAC